MRWPLLRAPHIAFLKPVMFILISMLTLAACSSAQEATHAPASIRTQYQPTTVPTTAPTESRRGRSASAPSPEYGGGSGAPPPTSTRLSSTDASPTYTPVTATASPTSGASPISTATPTHTPATPTPAPPTSTPTLPPPPPSPTENPVVQGGHVTEVVPVYPRTLNPIFADSRTEVLVESLIFNGLMQIDPKTKQPVTALAKSYDVSPDGRTYTFRLHSGIEWQNGDKLTADDVVWTYNLLKDPDIQAPLYPYAQLIKKVTAIDSQTVRFTLTEPYSAFPARLATVPVIPREPFSGLSGQKLRAKLLAWKPVGTGPFKVHSVTPGESIQLVANERYFRGAPNLDRYEFTVMRDPDAIKQALSAGKADVAWLPQKLASDLEGESKVDETRIPTPNVTFLFFNLDSNGAVRDRRVRQAILYALNRNKIASAMGPDVETASGFQPETSPAYNPSAEDLDNSFDPAKARKLLEQAGWTDSDGDGTIEKNGQPLEITIYYNEVPRNYPRVLGISYEPAMERMVRDLRAVGINARTEDERWDDLSARLYKAHDFDAAVLTLSTDADPDQTYLWASDSYSNGLNIAHLDDPQVDKLLAEGLKAQNPSERGRIYERLGKGLIKDLPAIPLFTSSEVVVRSKRLAGYGDSYWSAIQHSDVRNWYVSDGK